MSSKEVSCLRVLYEEAFHYHAPKVVRIKDSRLAVILVFLNWAVIVPMVWYMFVNHWAMDKEDSVVSYNSWLDTTAYAAAQGTSTPWYCGNSITDYTRSTSQVYTSNGCQALSLYEVFRTNGLDTELNFASFLQVAKYNRTCTVTEQPLSGTCSSPTLEGWGGAPNGGVVNNFVPFIEEMKVIFSHRVLEPLLADSPQNAGSYNYTNPATDIHTSTGTVARSISAGGDVYFTLAELVTWAGIDLEATRTCGRTACPYARQTGLRIRIDASYTNMRISHPFDYAPVATLTVRDVSGLWNTDGGKLHYTNQDLSEFSVVDTHPITIEIRTTGEMGGFSYFNTLICLIYLFVTVKIAGLFVDSMARISIKSFQEHTTEDEQSEAEQSSRRREMATTASVYPTGGDTMGADSSELMSQLKLLKDSFIYSARSDAQRDSELHELNRKVVDLKKAVEKASKANAASD